MGNYGNLTVKRIDKDLDGILEFNNEIIKAPFSLPNEVLQITKVDHTNKIPVASYNIVAPAQNRQKPLCAYYGVCGGCKGQHFLKADYIQYKIANIKNIFSFNKLPCPENMEFMHHLPELTGHRRRVVLSVQGNKIGFKAYHSNNVVKINSCPIATIPINKVLQLIQKHCNNNILKLTSITISNIGADVHIHFLATQNAQLPQLELLQPIFQNSHVQQVFWEYKKETTPLIIKKAINFTYGNVPVPFNGGFMQAEEFGEKALINLVKNALGKSTNILDLFCGFGSYALSLLSVGTPIIHCVDVNKVPLVALGKQPNITTECRNLFTTPYTTKELQKFSNIIINPPRVGAKAQILEIQNPNIKNIVMVYCNSNSAIAELKHLMVEQKFKIVKLAIIDQFIFSKHVELFIHLARE